MKEVLAVRIQETYELLQKNATLKELKEKELELEQFLINEYNPAIEKISHNYSFFIKLTTVWEKTTKRRAFLSTARNHLAEFKKIIEKNEEIYIPSLLIPPDVLKASLECGERLINFVDSMYQTEQASKRWRGFNLTNWYNKYNYYTSLMGPSDFDLDSNYLRELITKKIQLIDIELSIDITSDSIVQKITDELLISDSNLWNINKEFNAIIQKHPGKINLNGSFEHYLDSIRNNEKLACTFWADIKNKKEQDLKLLLLEQGVNSLDHSQATVLSDLYELEYIVSHIELEQTILDDIIQLLEIKNCKAGLGYLNSMQKKIQEINVDTLLSTKAGEKTSTQLLRGIGIQLDQQIIGLKKCIDVAEKLVEKPVGCVEKINRIDIELCELLQRKSNVDDLLEELKSNYKEKIKIILDKKEILIALNHLSKAINLLQTLLKEATPEQKDSDARNRLIDEIEKVPTKVFNLIEPYRTHSNEEVRMHYEEYINLSQQAREKLTSLRFAKIIDNYNALMMKPSKTMKKKEEFIHMMKQFKNQERPFINNTPEGEQIKLIEASVLDSIYRDREKQSLLYPLSEKYFAKNGEFDIYLQERASVYWVKDWFSQIAAFALGYLGYKTDAQEREEYINNKLKPSFEAYQANGDGKEEYEQLLKVIAKGQQKYFPRALVGDEHEKSLFKKLESFKVSLILKEQEFEQEQNEAAASAESAISFF